MKMCLSVLASRRDHENERSGGFIAVKILEFSSAKSFVSVISRISQLLSYYSFGEKL